MIDPKVTVAAREAREALRRLRNAPMKEHPAMPADELQRWWQTRYTAFICDFMCDELADEELSDWEETFTALHEMMGHAFATWACSDAVTEQQAWDVFDPVAHLVTGRFLTLLRPETDLLSFTPLFARLVRYLQSQGTMSARTADALAAAYDDGARLVAEADAVAEADTTVVPSEPGPSGPARAHHCITPLPGASPQARRRTKKTTYLVERLLKSRQGRHLDPGLASFAIHMLVAEHAEAHGHREWDKLDVNAVVEHLQTHGSVPPVAVPMLTDAWHGFVEWLVAKNRLAAQQGARLHAEIEAAQSILESAEPHGASRRSA